MPGLAHDFVYLSSQKLADLIVQTSVLQRRRFGVRVEARSPVVSLVLASTSVPATNGSSSERIAREELVKLDKARDEINNRSLWYSDPAVQAGSWIYFESPLNYCILQSEYFNPAVVFVDHVDLLPDSSVRLFLHGSVRHLLGRPKVIDISADIESLHPSPSSGEFVYALADNVAEVVRLIHGTQDALTASPGIQARKSLSSSIARLLRSLDQKFVPDTAAWLGGVARVTAPVSARGEFRNVERFVMATPLYIEYVSPPI